LDGCQFTSRLPHHYTYSYSLHRLTPNLIHHHSTHWFSSHRKNSHNQK
jgi:hypothetical protein